MYSGIRLRRICSCLFIYRDEIHTRPPQSNVLICKEYFPRLALLLVHSLSAKKSSPRVIGAGECCQKGLEIWKMPVWVIIIFREILIVMFIIRVWRSDLCNLKPYQYYPWLLLPRV